MHLKAKWCGEYERESIKFLAVRFINLWEAIHFDSYISGDTFCKLNWHVRGLEIGATMATIRDISKVSFGITSDYFIVHMGAILIICSGNLSWVIYVSTLRFLRSLFNGLQTFEEEYLTHLTLTCITCESVFNGTICVVNCGRHL